MKTSAIILILTTIISVFITSTNCAPRKLYDQCPDGKEVEDLQSKVVVSNCTRLPCKLKKGTSIQISLKVKPDRDVSKLTTSVHANIVGVPFPFIGVDGTNACDDIYDPEGKKVVGCPLKANEEYVYLKAIDVLTLYPNIKTRVHWALTAPDGDIMCFEVPARIVG